MPLFGNKKNKNADIPEVVDFSNDTWSYKGEAPVYQIQSDGFSYDVVDADGNDKNAISLGLSGMLVIVLNAKSPKIKEEEILPYFAKVIKTRNWHSMTVKEANFLVQTAIKKLTSSAMSGDVFDLASYAPLDVKRVLLKTLFTISRTQMKPEFREESEHRIIDDIVPEIFAHPDYELALLTGLIIKPDPPAAEPVSGRVATHPVLDTENNVTDRSAAAAEQPAVQTSAEAESDSAFAELQKIYGRKSDQLQARTAVNTSAAAAAVSYKGQVSQEPVSAGNGTASEYSKSENGKEAVAQQNNPFAQTEPQNVSTVSVPNFSAPQPNNPFAQPGPGPIPQPGTPNFSAKQPNNPFTQQGQGNIPQPAMPNFSVPQPPMPNFGMQQQNPYGNMNAQNNVPMPNPGYPQNPYQANPLPYQGQMWQQNPQNMQQPYWQQNPQNMQNVGGYPQNSPTTQNSDGQNVPFYPGWMNRPPMPQQPPQNNQNTDNA